MSNLFGASTTATAAANNTQGEIKNDIALNSPPEDGITDLAFSPQSDHLAVASWDKKVRIYEIANNGQSEGKALLEMGGPVLNTCWSPVSSTPTPSFELERSLMIQPRTAKRL